MGTMKRSLLVPLATLLLAALVPATALAAEIELGATSTAVVAPVCPAGVSQSACKIVLTQVTALETVRDGVDYPTTVRKAGEIVAFTLGVSALSSSAKTVAGDIKYLNTTYGGSAQAELTVLRPIGKHSLRQWAVAAQSADYHLQSYLGQVVQFPLATPLPVVPGEVIALTVPTWAPVLSFDLTPSKFAYRQSRKANCTYPPASLQAQLTIGQNAAYQCDYPGTRVEYTATEITSPTPTP
jgi:hypothetical protein